MRAAGVQSEMELAFAGLHQLCAPMLTRLEHLAPPQREALRTAFGMSAGPPPDRFLVGLAVLSLLCEAAGEQPLVCVVDDQQWLDRASAQALGFVARRLAADPVAMVFGTRVPGADLAGLPELAVAGLQDGDARALLGSVLPGPLDARVRDQIVAETRGNPLALLELPRGLTPGQLAGGFGLPAAVPLSGRIEESFGRQLDALPPATRQLLQLAAADPSGDSSLVWRAAGRLGLPMQAAAPAAEAGLAEFGARVRFRHPLLRSVAYRSASVPDRQAAHLALAEVTDPAADPDRRAWHRAHAALGPDEEVAAELVRSADRAQARGGLAAGAAFLERAARLTADPARRTERMLAAAQVHLEAGEFGGALALLAAAEAESLDELASTRIDLLRGHVTFASGLGSDAPPLLLKAAKRLEPLDLRPGPRDLPDRMDSGPVRRPPGRRRRPARGFPRRPGPSSARAASGPGRPGPGRPHPAGHRGAGCRGAHLAAGHQRLCHGGPGRGRRASGGAGWFRPPPAPCGTMTPGARCSIRQARLAREVGALEQLPIILGALGTAVAWSGDFAEAAGLIAESDAVCEATGSRAAPFTAMLLACLRGEAAAAAPLIEATVTEATAGGQGVAVDLRALGPGGSRQRARPGTPTRWRRPRRPARTRPRSTSPCGRCPS